MGVNRGKDFESHIQESWQQCPRTLVKRVHDQTTGYLGSSNECDFLIFHSPYLYAIECKSVHGNTLSIHSNPKKDKNGRLHGFYGNITDTQWTGLLEMSQIRNVFAGIIVWFIDHDETLFLDINLLKRWRDAGHKSIHCYPEWIDYVQSPSDWSSIKGHKKRIYFDYDMQAFMKEMEYERERLSIRRKESP